MLNTKSFVAVDFGAGSLKLAEFEINETGGLRLKQYGLKSLGAEGAQEGAREAAIQSVLQAMLNDKGIKAKNVNVCAPGFHVFSKFVKLPPVDAGKVTQMIQYEAQQNVPFPLEEVVWDYQILGSTAGGELEVLLVAIKADIVEGLFRVTENAGMRLQLCDVSSAALCNSFRYNYGDLEDCTMLLDIGAKTSNLLFFEKGKVFSRSINLGANSITQDFANESKLKWDTAEKLKIEEGFVSLGGAYEEPENAHQAAISKIARQFMTRLHIQVNQTMQFYRGQQGGSAPQRLFLSGGASVMPYTAQFFAEKLNVPVEYFNPLRNVQIDPAINLEELARVAHSLGEVVGLGLRNMAHCPVELNLMPQSTLKWQSFNQKKPYFIATVFSLVLVIWAVGFLFERLADVKKNELEKAIQKVGPEEEKEVKFKKAYHTELKKAQQDVNQIVTWMDDRYFWADVLSEVRRGLIQVELATRAKLRTDVGVWLEQMTSAAPKPEGEQLDTGAGASPMQGPRGMEGAAAERFRARYGLDRRGPPPPPLPGAEPPPASPEAAAGGGGDQPAKKPKGDTNEIASVTFVFRGVDVATISGKPEANKDIAYDVLKELQDSPVFDKAETKTTTDVTPDIQTGTFTFSIQAQLKRPLKL
jgi:type IV pilus assembly protein PilM